MNHLDLFTGILGFAYAAKAVWGDEYNLVACCEKDKFCQELIRKRAPGVPIFDDIRTLTKDCINEPIDLITGGFPCQPFSVAGHQKSKEDDRYLWDEMFRVIKEIRPLWVVAENVTGIIKLALDDVLSDLETEGYTTEAYIIPAAGIGAPHKRERVWIIAHAQSAKWQRSGIAWSGITGPTDSNFNVANPNGAGLQGYGQSGECSRKCSAWSGDWETPWVEVAARFCRVDDGVSNRLDRLKALGNAIVPQVAMQIFEAIKSQEYLINKTI